MSWYFCSYMAFKRGNVFGYGDCAFQSNVDDGNEFIGEVKDSIIKRYYDDGDSIKIVITALNKI